MNDDIPEFIRCPPVLMIGFCRPETLAQVFAKVREVRPTQLFLWLNKGRSDRPNEVAGNEACRKIFDGVDWPCDVHRVYNEKYLECIDSFQGALDWFFGTVDRGVILEDDCVPDVTFFRYCGELLERYKDDVRIGTIGGHIENPYMNKVELYGDSYYFDHYSQIFGWASWSRAWKLYDPQMRFWPEFDRRFALMEGIFHSPRTRAIYQGFWRNRYKNGGEWDSIWFMTQCKENMLCIHPSVNLVSNVGIGQSSRVSDRFNWIRRILARRNKWANVKRMSMKFPMQHPPFVFPNIFAEKMTFRAYGYTRIFAGQWIAFRRFLKRYLAGK